MSEIENNQIPITEEQISTVLHALGTQLRLQTEALPRDLVKYVLGQPGLGSELVQVLCGRVATAQKFVIRKVTVNGGLSLPEVFFLQGDNKYNIDSSVVNAIPNSTGGEKEVIFFQPRLSICATIHGHHWITPEALAKEYEYLGLVPNVRAVAKVNQDDPTFLDKYPNAVQWSWENGKFCSIGFHKSDDIKTIFASHPAKDYPGVQAKKWWFGGVLKE